MEPRQNHLPTDNLSIDNRLRGACCRPSIILLSACRVPPYVALREEEHPLTQQPRLLRKAEHVIVMDVIIIDVVVVVLPRTFRLNCRKASTDIVVGDDKEPIWLRDNFRSICARRTPSKE